MRVIRRAYRGQGGFSLIEVMVSLVVLALGLLGFALLQTMNLRYTQSADYRTRATNLAYELLDQMRINKMAAAEFTAASFTAGEVSGGACTRTVGGRLPVVGDGGVIQRWQCDVVNALGDQATADVRFNLNSGLASIELSWGERVGGGDTTFAVETQL